MDDDRGDDCPVRLPNLCRLWIPSMVAALDGFPYA